MLGGLLDERVQALEAPGSVARHGSLGCESAGLEVSECGVLGASRSGVLGTSRHR